MYCPRRGLCFDGMSLGTVVLDEHDGYSRGARLAQQNRDIRQNTILQFRRHQPHQADLNIDYQQRRFQSALFLSSTTAKRKPIVLRRSSYKSLVFWHRNIEPAPRGAGSKWLVKGSDRRLFLLHRKDQVVVIVV